jgi:hypothetical protein
MVSATFSETGDVAMQELEQLRGSHHCIGTGRAVADLIFKMLHSHAVENGGMISADDILSVKAQFILDLPLGMDLFERINQECMHASGSAAPDPFSQDHILSTLLLACGEGSARHAFNLQIAKCGPNWLNYFFQGLAEVAQKNLRQESWQDLIAAYVQAAEIYKANMQVLDVIARNDVRILSDSIAPLYEMFESNQIVPTSSTINNFIARQYKFTGPRIVKITDDQIRRFLTMLSKEMSLKLHLP